VGRGEGGCRLPYLISVSLCLWGIGGGALGCISLCTDEVKVTFGSQHLSLEFKLWYSIEKFMNTLTMPELFFFFFAIDFNLILTIQCTNCYEIDVLLV
jgi:hypothetical protein